MVWSGENGIKFKALKEIWHFFLINSNESNFHGYVKIIAGIFFITIAIQNVNFIFFENGYFLTYVYLEYLEFYLKKIKVYSLTKLQISIR